ncbi:glycoside hydrolase family 92 protein [Xylariaceae sp. FL0594]|nr:glycoside hydrolase family 92 protein [Xylariaceae sp. FL0594]
MTCKMDMKLSTLCLFICLYTTSLSSAYPNKLPGTTQSNGQPWTASYHQNTGVLKYVNPHIGTYGTSPDDNGGMFPSVGVPFGMTRWTAQTRENYISQVPYHDGDAFVHGFQATHQPAIWMGELGQMVLMPGWSDKVKPAFEQRGLALNKEEERSTPYVYEATLDADTEGEHDWDLTEAAVGGGPVPGGAGQVPDGVRQGANGRTRRRRSPEPQRPQRLIRAAMSALAHTGHLRLDYEAVCPSSWEEVHYGPYVFIQATRQNWTGYIEIDAARREVSGYNPQRQDYSLGPDKPANFKGYFVSRFSEPFESYGTTSARSVFSGSLTASGNNLGGYVRFSANTHRVEVRTGISFVSIEQARRNLDIEIQDGRTFEDTVEQAKAAWLEKLGRVIIEGTNDTDAQHDQRTIWYTGLYHALQYPNDYSEPTSSQSGSPRTFYNGYTDSIHTSNESYYQSWSIWDTYRAEHSLLTLFAPERVNGMMRSLLNIFDWSGRLPMWANMVETNIMIATNADIVLANALSRGFRSFNISKAWQAVKKDAYVPPERDTELLYYDREPNTPYEARAGLTSYLDHGWVDNDGWSESASRTLDYAFDDAACAIVARVAGEHEAAKELSKRSKNYVNLWNPDTQFMQARNANGSFANDTMGWTEGDKWVYTFDVPHDIGGLASLFKGGRDGLKARLDEHFNGGHNMHSNEPSHHVPYLYSLIGYPNWAADRIRRIVYENYNATSAGLSGNEDLGQMSAWFVLSALGFYPVNPAGDEYVIGTPFFERVTLQLPDGAATGGEVGPDGSRERRLVISAPGAPSKPYVRRVTVDGKTLPGPVIKHSDLVNARLVHFDMSE